MLHSSWEAEEQCAFGPTQRFVGYPVHSQDEIVFEEDVAHDGEEVDEDEGEHGRQHDGAAVARDALYDVQQGLFSVHQVEKLRGEGCLVKARHVYVENMQEEQFVCRREHVDSFNSPGQ